MPNVVRGSDAALRESRSQPLEHLAREYDGEPAKFAESAPPPHQKRPASAAKTPKQLTADLLFEHAYLARVLNTFEDHLTALRNQKTVDYTIMHEIMHYIIHYPDLYHHPREHLIFERLRTHDPFLAGIVRTLEREHTLGYEAGQRLLALMVAACEYPTPKLARRILNGGDHYVEKMRAHMHREESMVLSRIPDLLTMADCKAIAMQFKTARDPLIEEAGPSPYPSLLGHLQETVKSVCTHASPLDHLKGLVVVDSLTEVCVGARQVADIVSTNVRETYTNNLNYWGAALQARSITDLWRLTHQALGTNWRQQQDMVNAITKTCQKTANNAAGPFKAQLTPRMDKGT